MSKRNIFSFSHPSTTKKQTPETGKCNKKKTKKNEFVAEKQTNKSNSRNELLKLWENIQIQSPTFACLVDSQNNIYSFQYIHKISDDLVKLLLKLKAKQQQQIPIIIGIALDQNPSEIVVLLACLKVGIPWFPLPNPKLNSNTLVIKESLSFLGSNVSIIVTSNEIFQSGKHLFCYDDIERTLIYLNDDGSIFYSPPLASFDSHEQKITKTAMTLTDEMEKNDILYLLRTSGTSGGAPKFVKGLCDSTLNRLRWQWDNWPFPTSQITKVVRRSPLVFVDSVAEIFGTLLGGGCLVIPAIPLIENPDGFIANCRELEATRITIVPTILEMLLKSLSRSNGSSNGYLIEALPKLTEWIVSGEPLGMALFQSFLHATTTSMTSNERNKQRRGCCFKAIATNGVYLMNLYGSTEVAGDVTSVVLAQPRSIPWQEESPGQYDDDDNDDGDDDENDDDDDDNDDDDGDGDGVKQRKKQKRENKIPAVSNRVRFCSSGALVPVGYPITGVEIKIQKLNTPEIEHDELVKDGVVGEVVVEGVGVSGGYLELGNSMMQKLNTRLFTTPSSSSSPSSPTSSAKFPLRKFRTGDLGFKCCQCQCLYLIGRRDNQIKLHGALRVSLEEVEAKILAISADLKINTKVLAVTKNIGDDRMENLKIVVCFSAESSSSSSNSDASQSHPIDSNIMKIMKKAQSLLPASMLPSSVYSVHEFPRTRSGKVDRGKMTECIRMGSTTLLGLKQICLLNTEKHTHAMQPPIENSSNHFAVYEIKTKTKKWLLLEMLSMTIHKHLVNELPELYANNFNVIGLPTYQKEMMQGMEKGNESIKSFNYFENLLLDNTTCFQVFGGDSMNTVELVWRIENNLLLKLICCSMRSHLHETISNQRQEEIRCRISETVKWKECINPLNVLHEPIEQLSNILSSLVFSHCQDFLSTATDALTQLPHAIEAPSSAPSSISLPFDINEHINSVKDVSLYQQNAPIQWLTRSGLSSSHSTQSSLYIPPSLSSTSSTSVIAPAIQSHCACSMTVRWKVNLGKCVDASPLIIFSEQNPSSMTNNGKTIEDDKRQSIDVIIGSHSRIVVRVDALNGAEKWRKEVVAEKDAISDDASIEATAAISNDGNTVLISGYDGRLHALNATTGSEKWAVRSAAEIKGAPFVYPFSIPPSFNTIAHDTTSTVYCNTVFFGSHDEKVRCVSLNEVNGRAAGVALWELELDGAIYASPLVVKTRSNNLKSEEMMELLIVCTTKGSVYAYDLSEQNKSQFSPLITAAPPLFWRVSASGPLFATPAACGQRQVLIIATVSGALSCLNLLTGAIVWTRLSARGFFSSPILWPPLPINVTRSQNNKPDIKEEEEGVVLIGSHDGCLSCRDIATGARKWFLDLSAVNQSNVGGGSDVIFSSPFVFQSQSRFSMTYVSVATQSGRIVIVNLSRGDIVHQMILPGQIFSSSVVLPISWFRQESSSEQIVSTNEEFILYIGCRDDHLYALDLQIPINHGIN